MPPKASTSAADKPGRKVTDDEAEPYLIKQNRPYNATDLQANLKAKHNISKASVVKVLSGLAAKGEIVEKTYGKQLIYGPKQPETAVASDDLQSLKAEIATMQLYLAEIREAVKSVETEIVALKSAPTTSELPKQIATMEAEIASCSDHLHELRSKPFMMLNKDDVLRIDKHFDSVKKFWLQRRKAGRTICDMLADAMQLGKDAAREWLEEERGIEFDGPDLEALAKPVASVQTQKRKL